MVVAVHTHSLFETAPAFIAANYPNTNMVFAKDTLADGDALAGLYYAALGGRGTYPYTVVLDESGKILATFFSALDYEDLESIVEKQLHH
jgi:hypothetical protein